MKIVCSANMPFAKEAFGTLGETIIMPERAITAADVKDADILAIRSTTRVNRQLLEGSRVRFVATATIGYNHIDTGYLDARGIRWCAAPGCNANSVAEYFVSAMLSLRRRFATEIAGVTLGIVGVGNVGRLVAERASVLGMHVLLNDPPRARAEGPTGFASLADIRRQADIITFHVPLTESGPDWTVGMADEAFFRDVRRGCVIMNASRGQVVGTAALSSAIESGAVSRAILDVWETEPEYNARLLDLVSLGTPHIAGHSFEGKAMGTVVVYRQACDFLGVRPSWSHESLMPPPPVPIIETDAAGRDEWEVLWDIVSRVYNIEEDDADLRSGNAGDTAQRAGNFDAIRKKYKMRREFRFTTVKLRGASEALRTRIAALGFALDPLSRAKST